MPNQRVQATCNSLRLTCDLADDLEVERDERFWAGGFVIMKWLSKNGQREKSGMNKFSQGFP
jgi:hypothetical protein